MLKTGGYRRDFLLFQDYRKALETDEAREAGRLLKQLVRNRGSQISSITHGEWRTNYPWYTREINRDLRQELKRKLVTVLQRRRFVPEHWRGFHNYLDTALRRYARQWIQQERLLHVPSTVTEMIGRMFAYARENDVRDLHGFFTNSQGRKRFLAHLNANYERPGGWNYKLIDNSLQAIEQHKVSYHSFTYLPRKQNDYERQEGMVDDEGVREGTVDELQFNPEERAVRKIWLEQRTSAFLGFLHSSKVSQRDREIYMHATGLLTGEPVQQAEIARLKGMKHQRVDQVLKRIGKLAVKGGFPEFKEIIPRILPRKKL